MPILAVLLIMTPPHAPEAPITCARYIPNTNARLAEGVNYRYTQVEKMENALRCYCEQVKPLEHACKTRYPASQCISRTHQWVRDTFGPPMPAASHRGAGRNIIVNIQSR